MAHPDPTCARIFMAYLATCLAQGPAASPRLRLDAGPGQGTQATGIVTAYTTWDESLGDCATTSKSRASVPQMSACYAMHWH